MVDHNVMRFHIAVHNAFTVTVIQRLEEFEDVVSDIDVVELRIETPEIRVVDIFEDQGWCFALSEYIPVLDQKSPKSDMGEVSKGPVPPANRERRRAVRRCWVLRQGSGES